MLRETWTKKKLKDVMRHDVACMNVQWAATVIKSFNFTELLARTHPLYREEYIRIAKELNIRR